MSHYHDGVNDPHPGKQHWMVIEMSGGLIQDFDSCLINEISIVEIDYDEIEDPTFDHYMFALDQLDEALPPGEKRKEIRLRMMEGFDRPNYKDYEISPLGGIR